MTTIGKYVIYSKVEGGTTEIVDVLDDKDYAEYLCEMMNEYSGDYIKYWVAPAGDPHPNPLPDSERELGKKE